MPKLFNLFVLFLYFFSTGVNVFHQTIPMSLALHEQIIYFASPTIKGWKEGMEIRHEEDIGDCQLFH